MNGTVVANGSTPINYHYSNGVSVDIIASVQPFGIDMQDGIGIFELINDNTGPIDIYPTNFYTLSFAITAQLVADPGDQIGQMVALQYIASDVTQGTVQITARSGQAMYPSSTNGFLTVNAQIGETINISAIDTTSLAEVDDYSDVEVGIGNPPVNPISPSNLTVTAKYNDDTAANTFGDYLAGVGLNNPFTVSRQGWTGRSLGWSTLLMVLLNYRRSQAGRTNGRFRQICLHFRLWPEIPAW